VPCVNKTKVSWVLHHAEAYFSWSDVVISRVFVSFCFGFRFVIGLRWWSCVSWVWIRGLAKPGSARPSPDHAPLALPMRAPPPPDPFVSFDFSRAITSLSLFHLSLSPRGALGFGDGDRRSLDPRGELPLSLSLSLSLPHPFFLPAWPLPCALPSPARAPSPRAPPPRRRASPRRPAPSPRVAPSPAVPSRTRPHALSASGGSPASRLRPPARRRLGCPPRARRQSGPAPAAPCASAPGGGSSAPAPRPGLAPSRARARGPSARAACFRACDRSRAAFSPRLNSF
jgi:hypothetical protein